MPRRLRRLLALAGLVSALTAWRSRMLAANEAASIAAPTAPGQVTRQ